MTRGRRSLSVEGAIGVLALVVAFGTLGGMTWLHEHVLGTPEAPGGRSHLLRDGLLLLPLALAAVMWGLRSRCGARPAAARISLLFGALLIPATAAHGRVHAADETAVAHAASSDVGTLGMSGEGESIFGALEHAAVDALLAVPLAFGLSLVVLALLFRRGERSARTAARPRLLALAASTLVVAAAGVTVPVSGAASPEYSKFTTALKIPPVLTGEDINIDIAQTQQQILPGAKTTMWTYNDSFPGPVIRRPTGVPTRVTFTNNLPASAGSLSVHHHGTQAAESEDGHPNRYLIEPGGTKTYTYPGLDNNVAERAAPQWYHDHRDMVTGRNVWMGMVGAFIYDDPFEQSLDLPQGQFDVPLMVADRQFDADNQIPYTFVQSGTFGDVILVNGVPQPFFEVGDRRYRFRLYNISNRRDYTFRLSNGQAMTQIGTDSGLLPEPVTRTSIRLGPAERADVVVDFAGRLGEQIVLQNADAPLGPGERDDEVMQFRVTRDVTDDSSQVPATLRPLFETDPPVTTRVWDLDRTDGIWTINGKGFDPDRIDARPILGTTERWVFRNQTTLPHLAHTHLGDQKLVSRNGQPPSPSERVKETWYLGPGEEVVFDIKFADYAGTFVFHCHVLEHEDQRMMTQFQTVAPPDSPAPPPAAAPPPPVAAPPPPVAAARPFGPALRPVSRTLKLLSSKRLRNILSRGLRFEGGVTVKGATLRAELRVRGRRVGSVRRTRLSRGRVKVTLTLSRSEKARLRRLIAGRSRVAAQLKVTSSGETRFARFDIWR